MTIYRTILLITILAGITLIGYIYNDLASRGVFDRTPPIIIRKDSTYIPPITVNFKPGTGTIIERPLPNNIDSAKIARAYFNTVNYNDSIITDTVSIWLRETVSRNAIQSRELTYRLNIPIQTVTEYHQQARSSLILGGFGSYHDSKININALIGYQRKNGQIFFGSYGTNGSVSVGWMGRLRQ